MIPKEVCYRCGKAKPITELQDYCTYWGNYYNPPEYDSICKTCMNKEIREERRMEKDLEQYEKRYGKLELD